MQYPLIYLTLGYPTEVKFFKILKMLDELNIKAVEVGVPDSNPKLDGKIIQHAHKEVIHRGYSTRKIHTLLEAVINNHTFETVIMGYHQTLYAHGIYGNARFKDAHILCVDQQLTRHQHAYLIQLYHEGMDKKTIAHKLRHNTLFAYLMANRTGTGIPLKMEEKHNLQRTIKAIKDVASLPVFLGFGIKDPSHASTAGEIGADGIIIGSEFIKRSADDSVDALKDYVVAMGEAFTMSIQEK